LTGRGDELSAASRIGGATRCDAAARGDVLHATPHVLPLPWSRGENRLIFTARNRQSKDAALIGFNPRDGKFSVLQEASEVHEALIDGGALHDVSVDGRVLVMPMQSFNRPTDYPVFKDSPTHPRRLTDTNPELSAVSFGPARVIHWSLPDGTVRSGSLLLPPDYSPGTRYPAIITFCPGVDFSSLLNCFGGSPFGGLSNFEVFATRGYAVLQAQSVVLPDGGASRDRNCSRPRW
jgi:dipeptidyl aminopeptidase/acylaminoacyl peptidase